METKAVETRWRGMTVRYSFAISPHLSREFCLNVPPSETKGAGPCQRSIEFVAEQLFDELTRPNPYLGLDRIEPIVKKINSLLGRWL